MTLRVVVILFLSTLLWNSSNAGKTKGHLLGEPHILSNITFWNHFQSRVLTKSWSCNFPKSLLQDTLEEDSKLYLDDSVFRKRRLGATLWIQNHTLWTEVILGASKEIALGTSKGYQTGKLEKLQMLEAFEDYIDHLNFFYRVASRMAEKGETVTVFSQDSSSIHDIDKLDPVMIVAYSEQFEDGMSTSAWNKCMNRHTKVNPHHQAHCLWHNCCKFQNTCTFCDDVRTKALQEMVCDKVSRRVQKSLGGKLDDTEMWDVELSYFNGLNAEWLAKAKQMMQRLKP